MTIFSLLALVSLALLRADVIDESASLQNVFDEALLDIHGERWSPAIGENLRGARGQFARMLTDSEARDLWNAPLPPPVASPLSAAEALGSMQARLQHVAALEMISNQRAGKSRFGTRSGVRSSSCRSLRTPSKERLLFSVLGRIPPSAMK